MNLGLVPLVASPQPGLRRHNRVIHCHPRDSRSLTCHVVVSLRVPPCASPGRLPSSSRIRSERTLPHAFTNRRHRTQCLGTHQGSAAASRLITPDRHHWLRVA